MYNDYMQRRIVDNLTGAVESLISVVTRHDKRLSAVETAPPQPQAVSKTKGTMISLVKLVFLLLLGSFMGAGLMFSCNTLIVVNPQVLTLADFASASFIGVVATAATGLDNWVATKYWRNNFLPKEG